MKKISPYIFSTFLSLIILYLVITQTEPPKTLKEASFFQIVSLFLPLGTMFFSISYLAFNHLAKSLSVTLGLLLLLTVRGFFNFNILISLCLALGVITLGFVLKPKETKKYYTRIPKLSELHKQR